MMTRFLTGAKTPAYIIIIVLVVVAFNYVHSETLIRVVDIDGTEIITVPSIRKNGYQYLFLDDVFHIFRTLDDKQGVVVFNPKQQQYIPLTKKLTIEIKNIKFSLVINHNTVNVDGYAKSYTLSQPPVLYSDKPSMPIEFLTNILSQVLEIEIKFDINIQTLQIRGSAGEADKAEPVQLITTQDEQFRVIIDPGHGGSDVGVQSPTGLLIEKKLTLDIAKKVKALCIEHGISVYLTRDSDRFLTHIQRASIANKQHGDIFISIHFNASFSPNQSGFMVYVNNPAGRIRSLDTLPAASSKDSQLVKKLIQSDFLDSSITLAEKLFFELKSADLVGRPPVEIPLIALDSVYMPAVLLEVGYLSNASDEAWLSTPQSSETIAQSILHIIQKTQ